jgi:dihydrolipoamide dehydrogenase
MAEDFDLVVIGAGPGGYVAAIRAAQLGKRVACVDKRATLGGTCLNVGCIPSKALLDSSELYAQAKGKLQRHGVQVGEVGLDLKQMMTRKEAVVRGLTDGVAYLFKKNKVTWIKGKARIERPGVVQVDGHERKTKLETRAILLATGSEPAPLSALPFDGTHILSSTEALSLDRVPAHLIVVGGGYIGLEIGSVWARLGSKVTVLEFLPRIVAQADAEIGAILHKTLAKQGLDFHTETKVSSAKRSGDLVTLQAEENGRKTTFEGDKVLVAVGRRPVLAGLGLDGVGLAPPDKTGRIAVNADYQTNVSGIFAIGDLIAGPMLAHKAEDEGIVFAERLARMASHVNIDAIPSVIYTWPEVASVGLTEEQVKETKRDYRVGKFSFAANGRARCLDETEGLVKIIADARSDRVLGVHIIGPRASDLIAEAVTILEFAGSAEDIARISHAHPTLSEAVREAALAVDRRAIHS